MAIKRYTEALDFAARQSGRRALHARRRAMATDPGAHASEYADMSNVKPGEIPGRRKPEVSRATCFVPGLAGTYAEAERRRRWTSG